MYLLCITFRPLNTFSRTHQSRLNRDRLADYLSQVQRDLGDSASSWLSIFLNGDKTGWTAGRRRPSLTGLFGLRRLQDALLSVGVVEAGHMRRVLPPHHHVATDVVHPRGPGLVLETGDLHGDDTQVGVFHLEGDGGRVSRIIRVHQSAHDASAIRVPAVILDVDL